MKKRKPRLRVGNTRQYMLGVEVKVWRDERFMGQKELADILGCSDRQLRKIENGSDTIKPLWHWALTGELPERTRKWSHVLFPLDGTAPRLIKDPHMYDTLELAKFPEIGVVLWREYKPAPVIGPPRDYTKNAPDGLGPLERLLSRSLERRSAWD